MYRTMHTRQLMAILLIAVMALVHVVKALHTHSLHNTCRSYGQETEIKMAGHVHETCSICEYHFNKDTSLTSQPVLVIAPVYAAPTYSRLITAINSDRLFTTEGRGPPHA